jgi:hypothetical protein
MCQSKGTGERKWYAGTSSDAARPLLHSEMQRLRDKRPVPGSVEEMLVESVRACRRLDTSQIGKRRVYAQVVDAALGRGRRASARSRAHPKLWIGLVLVGGVALVAALVPVLVRHPLVGSRGDDASDHGGLGPTWNVRCRSVGRASERGARRDDGQQRNARSVADHRV